MVYTGNICVCAYMYILINEDQLWEICLIILIEKKKLHKTKSQLEDPGPMVIAWGELSFLEEGLTVVWKSSLASGSTGVSLREIDHHGSSSAPSAKEDIAIIWWW